MGFCVYISGARPITSHVQHVKSSENSILERERRSARFNNHT